MILPNVKLIHEALLKARRLMDGRVEVLVRWKGMDSSLDTWEPVESIPVSIFGSSLNQKVRDLLNAEAETVEIVQPQLAENVYAIEKVIFAITDNAGKTYVYIKWEHYPLSEANWEPVDNVTDYAAVATDIRDARRRTAKFLTGHGNTLCLPDRETSDCSSAAHSREAGTAQSKRLPMTPGTAQRRRLQRGVGRDPTTASSGADLDVLNNTSGNHSKSDSISSSKSKRRASISAKRKKRSSDLADISRKRLSLPVKRTESLFTSNGQRKGYRVTDVLGPGLPLGDPYTVEICARLLNAFKKQEVMISPVARPAYMNMLENLKFLYETACRSVASMDTSKSVHPVPRTDILSLTEAASTASPMQVCAIARNEDATTICVPKLPEGTAQTSESPSGGSGPLTSVRLLDSGTADEKVPFGNGVGQPQAEGSVQGPAPLETISPELESSEVVVTTSTEQRSDAVMDGLQPSEPPAQKDAVITLQHELFEVRKHLERELRAQAESQKSLRSRLEQLLSATTHKGASDCALPAIAPPLSSGPDTAEAPTVRVDTPQVSPYTAVPQIGGFIDTSTPSSHLPALVSVISGAEQQDPATQMRNGIDGSAPTEHQPHATVSSCVPADALDSVVSFGSSSATVSKAPFSKPSLPAAAATTASKASTAKRRETKGTQMHLRSRSAGASSALVGGGVTDVASTVAVPSAARTSTPSSSVPAFHERSLPVSQQDSSRNLPRQPLRLYNNVQFPSAYYPAAADPSFSYHSLSPGSSCLFYSPYQPLSHPTDRYSAESRGCVTDGRGGDLTRRTGVVDQGSAGHLGSAELPKYDAFPRRGSLNAPRVSAEAPGLVSRPEASEMVGGSSEGIPPGVVAATSLLSSVLMQQQQQVQQSHLQQQHLQYPHHFQLLTHSHGQQRQLPVAAPMQDAQSLQRHQQSLYHAVPSHQPSHMQQADTRLQQSLQFQPYLQPQLALQYPPVSQPQDCMLLPQNQHHQQPVPPYQQALPAAQFPTSNEPISRHTSSNHVSSRRGLSAHTAPGDLHRNTGSSAGQASRHSGRSEAVSQCVTPTEASALSLRVSRDREPGRASSSGTTVPAVSRPSDGRQQKPGVSSSRGAPVDPLSKRGISSESGTEQASQVLGVPVATTRGVASLPVGTRNLKCCGVDIPECTSWTRLRQRSALSVYGLASEFLIQRHTPVVVRCYCQHLERLTPAETEIISQWFLKNSPTTFRLGLECTVCSLRDHVLCSVAWKALLSPGVLDLDFTQLLKTFVCIPCRLHLLDPLAAVERILALAIVQPPVLATAGGAQSGTKTVKLDFRFSQSEITGLEAGSLQLQLRGTELAPNTYRFAGYPRQVAFRVNTSATSAPLFVLKPPGPHRKRKEEPHFVATAALQLRKRNHISMECVYQSSATYLFSAVLVANGTPESILENVTTHNWLPLPLCRDLCRGIVHEANQRINSSDEVVVERQDVNLTSLRCPSTLMRIEIPGRGLYCKHLQCFDVAFYIPSQTRIGSHKNRWKCPVCYRFCYPHEIILDHFFKSILDQTTELDRTVYLVFTNDSVSWRVTEKDDEPDESCQGSIGIAALAALADPGGDKAPDPSGLRTAAGSLGPPGASERHSLSAGLKTLDVVTAAPGSSQSSVIDLD